MSHIQKIKAHKFSQINLDSKERILLIRGLDGIKITKLGYFNQPQETVCFSDNILIANLIYKLGINADFIRYLSDRIIKCRDIEEVKAKFSQLEQELSNIS